MAKPGETEKLPEPPSLAAQSAQLLQLLGGTKTTTSPGDTGALQKTFADLQGTDYEAMLKAIFQQAGGQIPGLQQALGNAIGARSGGNSAVQAALQKLLAQTSTGAMDQVAKLQSQNFATQANVGQSIANATKGTTQKTGTDVGGGLSKAAQLLGLLQATKALGINDMVKKSFSDTPASDAVAGAVSTPALQSASGALTSAAAPAVDYSLGSASGAATSPFSIGDQFTGADYTLPSTDLSSVGLQAPAQQQSPYDYQLGSFDYGLSSGADTSQGLDYAPNYTVEDYVDPAIWEPDYSLFADGGLVTKKAEGYADGGTVRAGGSRRSANPSVEIRSPDQMLAQTAAEELRGQFGVQGGPAAMGPNASTVASASSTDIANALASRGLLSGGGSGGDGASFSGGASPSGAGGGITGQDVASTIGTIGAINSISGLTGGASLPSGVMQGLGVIGGLAAAQTPEQALGVVGRGALGAIDSRAGALVGLAMNPSIPNAVDLGLSFANPGYALANTTLGLFGLAGPAQIAENAYNMMNPNQMMTPEQQAVVEAEQAAAVAQAQMQAAVEAANPTSAGLTGQANSMEGDALDSLMSLTNSFGTGLDSSTPGHAGYSGDPSGGFGADGNTNDGAGGYGGADNGYADGGVPKGVADNIDISVSEGEFIISADVVETLGEDFFNQLQAAFHTPAAQQRRA